MGIITETQLEALKAFAEFFYPTFNDPTQAVVEKLGVETRP